MPARQPHSAVEAPVRIKAEVVSGPPPGVRRDFLAELLQVRLDVQAFRSRRDALIERELLGQHLADARLLRIGDSYRPARLTDGGLAGARLARGRLRAYNRRATRRHHRRQQGSAHRQCHRTFHARTIPHPSHGPTNSPPITRVPVSLLNQRSPLAKEQLSIEPELLPIEKACFSTGTNSISKARGRTFF